MSILGRALKGFSANPDWFINWTFEAPRNSDVLFDLWSWYSKYYASLKDPETCYKSIRKDFEKHVRFFLDLVLS